MASDTDDFVNNLVEEITGEPNHDSDYQPGSEDGSEDARPKRRRPRGRLVESEDEETITGDRLVSRTSRARKQSGPPTPVRGP